MSDIPTASATSKTVIPILQLHAYRFRIYLQDVTPYEPDATEISNLCWCTSWCRDGFWVKLRTCGFATRVIHDRLRRACRQRSNRIIYSHLRVYCF